MSSLCVYDLDNILLDKLPESQATLYAEFTLENVLVEGKWILQSLWKISEEM